MWDVSHVNRHYNISEPKSYIYFLSTIQIHRVIPILRLGKYLLHQSINSVTIFTHLRSSFILGHIYTQHLSNYISTETLSHNGSNDYFIARRSSYHNDSDIICYLLYHNCNSSTTTTATVRVVIILINRWKFIGGVESRGRWYIRT